MKKIKKLIKLFIFVIIFPVLFLFLFLFKLRIGYLSSDKIGDLTTISNSFYLDTKMNKFNKYRVIWFKNDFICNYFIYKNIEKYLIIINSFMIHFSYEFLKKNNFKNLIVDKNFINSNKIVQNFHLTNKFKSMISFEGFENEIKNIEKKFDIKNKKIITFSVRSGNYHINEQGKTSDRNYSINTLSKTFFSLKKRDYNIFRINSEPLANYDVKLKGTFFDPQLDKFNVTHSYLVNKSDLFISSPSGPIGLALILNKPIVLINFTPWKDLMFCNPNFTKNIIFKKYRDISSKKLIKFKTVIESKLYEKKYNEDLLKLGVELVDNDEEEIFQAVEETLFNKIYNDENEIEKNKILNDFFNFYKNYFKTKNINLKVSNYFFKTNKNLFYL
jgi:putative glycosyltransferase (TIGR04372 family)